jgi:hypothetical protein
MQLTAALASRPEALLTRRNGAVAAALALGAALSIALASDQQLSKAVASGVQESVNGVKTVAAMLADRSPGQRPKGALAKLKQLKHRRAAAAPVSRHMLPAVAGILPAPEAPSVVPPPIAVAPPFAVVAGAPPIAIPPVSSPSSGGGGGGGGGFFFPGMPGGGGGGVILPPTVTELVPPPPVTAAVPEPASWAMMLFGFAMLGGVFRRQKLGRRQLANS